LQVSESSLQAQGVELIDRKCSDTTLRASWAANQPLSAAARRLGQCGIHDLNKRPVFGSGENLQHEDISIM
jgi:hypothetical protein